MGRKLDDWIAGYRAYTAGTESPAVFHLWVALGTIASAAQRKVMMDAGYYPVHSNLYVILVSPAGRSRKSTALRIGKGLLVGVRDHGETINFTTQASSVAAMVKQFTTIANKDHQSLTAFASELGSLLGVKSVEMTDFLTDIYDCEPDWDKQTISRSLEKIEHPWFNLLGGTTPQWMGDNLSKTAIEGGFVSRSIFVYEDTRLLVAFPELTPEQRAIRKMLIHDLAHICTLKGVFEFSPDAKAFYKEWYEDPDRAKQEQDYRIAGYYERKHIHVLKVAMCLSLAQQDRLVLEIPHIQAAIALLESIEPGMRKAFRSVGKNMHGTTLERVRDLVLSSGTIQYKKLLAANIHDIDKESFDKLLQSLVDMGDVVWKNNMLMTPHAAKMNGRKPLTEQLRDT